LIIVDIAKDPYEA